MNISLVNTSGTEYIGGTLRITIGHMKYVIGLGNGQAVFWFSILDDDQYTSFCISPYHKAARDWNHSVKNASYTILEQTEFDAKFKEIFRDICVALVGAEFTNE